MNPSCELLLQHYPRISEIKDLYPTYVANCVFNSFLCYTAIVLNILTIQALRRTSSLPKTLKPLLLSLAVSDVGVGLLVHPFYTSILVRLLQNDNSSCGAYKAFLVIRSCLSTASFLGVTAISLDRFLAIHLHLRYQELVTQNRIIAVATSTWLISAFVSLATLWAQPANKSGIISSGGFMFLFFTTVVYIRIYLAIRRHKNQIQALQVQEITQAGEMANFASLIKSTVGIFYAYLTFLACYLPFLICLAVLEFYGPTIALKRFLLFSSTLLYLNSSLNPVIYCWKMRHIRHAIIDILRNITCRRNQ